MLSDTLPFNSCAETLGKFTILVDDCRTFLVTYVRKKKIKHWYRKVNKRAVAPARRV